MAQERDAGGWIGYCLSVLFPAIIVFGVLGWTSTKTHGGVHIVLMVLAVLVWAVAFGLLIRGRNRYLTSDR